ncbi:MAG: 16S rRNA (cytidine(1402)-2'-O)-methyltransferase [Nitrospirae bacterium]|nr:16S rRNA (cytidine(1402)-2'-O)-methyltransferase [Nitrospirota bacterium]
MKPGTLYIVATPIGNLEDITLRALRVLKEVSLIAAEDTRRTQKLLAHYGIHTPLTSYHAHNQWEKAEVLLHRLHAGEAVALVSDAGTPAISDPGVHLIRRCYEAGIRVVPVPGPSAVMAAISVAGLRAEQFRFEGFLPSRRSARLQRIRALAEEEAAVVLFEAPHRIAALLRDLHEVLGDRQVVLLRELTKLFEERIAGALPEVLKRAEAAPLKGEMTLIIEGTPRGADRPKAMDPQRMLKEARRLEAEGISRKEALAQVARQYGFSRRVLYQMALAQPGGKGRRGTA